MKVELLIHSASTCAYGCMLACVCTTCVTRFEYVGRETRKERSLRSLSSLGDRGISPSFFLFISRCRIVIRTCCRTGKMKLSTRLSVTLCFDLAATPTSCFVSQQLSRQHCGYGISQASSRPPATIASTIRKEHVNIQHSILFSILDHWIKGIELQACSFVVYAASNQLEPVHESGRSRGG